MDFKQHVFLLWILSKKELFELNYLKCKLLKIHSKRIVKCATFERMFWKANTSEATPSRLPNDSYFMHAAISKLNGTNVQIIISRSIW